MKGNHGKDEDKNGRYKKKLHGTSKYKNVKDNINAKINYRKAQKRKNRILNEQIKRDGSIKMSQLLELRHKVF